MPVLRRPEELREIPDMVRLTSRSPDDTSAYGRRLGSLLAPGAVVSLNGPLGVGKTLMAKAIVSELAGVDEAEVTSPAFSIVNEYERDLNAGRVVHIDFYRLETLSLEDEEMLAEYLSDPATIAIVEWGSRFLPRLCASDFHIDMAHASDEDASWRAIVLATRGDPVGKDEVLREMTSYVHASD